MRGPDFLVIGTPKAGSTWLQFVLSAHPEIFIPPDRNEIHYFDRNIDKRSPEWYYRFFQDASQGQLAGEVTPHYLYVDDPAIFRNVESVQKFIVILRNPVQRCISHYKFRIRLDNYKGSLTEFCKDHSGALKWGEYARWLDGFYNEYNKDQLLVLVYEEATKNTGNLLDQLARFLEVDRNRFDESALQAKVNSGFKPRFPLLYKSAIKVSKFMLRNDMLPAFNRLKSVVKPVVSSSVKDGAVGVTPEEIAFLNDYYAEGVQNLERMLGRALWRIDSEVGADGENSAKD